MAHGSPLDRLKATQIAHFKEGDPPKLLRVYIYMDSIPQRWVFLGIN